MGIDTILSGTALLAAYNLRFDGKVPIDHKEVMWFLFLFLPVLRPLSILLLTGYRNIWRYFSFHDARLLAFSSVPVTTALFAARAQLNGKIWFAYVPSSVIILEFFLFLSMAASVRSFRRMASERKRGTTKRRALIIGTPQHLAVAIRQVSAAEDVQIAGAIADGMVGSTVSGIRVLGSLEDLADVLKAIGAELVLISDVELDVGSIVSVAARLEIEVRLLPSAENVLKGGVRVAASVDAEKVFRDSESGKNAALSAAANAAIADQYRNKTVLVTGAGGSIGSEICRQLARFPIHSLVMFDNDENSIFHVGNELAKKAKGLRVVPLVGDIRNEQAVRSAYSRLCPQVVLHAAAYKHVPVMEANCSEAVLNNVMGTRIVLDQAIEHGAERFLLISSDKAVRPTSIMGATKRVAEMVVQTRAQKLQGSSRLACVRFGNVAGSRGSVIPIFLRQIELGEPVTVTDERMTRYFMTIPEAVHLVLHTSVLGCQGNVYMFDMGSPVSIGLLAKRVVEMSGFRPELDIPIHYTGIRPGEKLHENLWTEGSIVSRTTVERIFSVMEDSPPGNSDAMVNRLEELAHHRDDDQVRQYLLSMPISFCAETIAAAAV